MILVTVGTQLPFDRLVRAMDAFAPQLSEVVFAQIGNGDYIPRNFEYCRMAPPDDLAKRFQRSNRIVSHAGTGSLLTARRFGKPIILFPRRASLGEHRNEHQLATCQQLAGEPGLAVAYDEAELWSLLSGQVPYVPPGRTDVEGGSKLGRELANYIRQLD